MSEQVALVAFGYLGHEDGANRLLEHVMQALLCERRALHVRVRLDLFGQLDALLATKRLQVLLLQHVHRVRVVAQINFGALHNRHTQTH